MPSAQSHRLTTLKKRIQAYAARSKARARRLLSAVVIAGSMSLAASCMTYQPALALDRPTDPIHGAVNELLSNPLRETAADINSIEQDRQAVDQELEYWVFSDDFCGWASVKEILQADASFEARNELKDHDESLTALLDSLKLESLLKSQRPAGNWSPIDPRASMPQALAIEDSLVSIAEQEPVDVESSPMTVECHRAAELPSVNNAPSEPSAVASADEYQAYDLSHADQIALRMYPMSIPHFHYLGGRRTESRSAFDYDSRATLDPALDCLGGGLLWIEEVQPSQSIEITRQSESSEPVDFGINRAWSQCLDMSVAIQQHAMRLQRDCDFYRSQIGSAVIDAVQPESDVRSAVAGQAIGHELASVQLRTQGVAERQWQRLASRLGDRTQMIVDNAPPAAPEPTAGEKLLSRAGIEANTDMMTAAGVADDAVNRVCCPVEQSDVASRLPATYALAAVGVATATLKTPHAPSDALGDELKVSSNPAAHAEAFATACDTAAETLESLAKALRKAGDSFIRVARTGTDPGLTREPSAELR